MKILVIPDIHLKPWMFARASELMQTVKTDMAVCLMDIADDWGQQYNLDLYVQTYDAAIRFAKENPDTLWCYGNHDLCYLWDQRESGYSAAASWTVREKLGELKETVPDKAQMAYIHRIGSVLFSHGGMSDYFVRKSISSEKYDDIDAVVKTINSMGCTKMWTDGSPIWYRPQYGAARMYKPVKLLQVLGHTPVTEITREKNIYPVTSFRPTGTGDRTGHRNSCTWIQRRGSMPG